MSRIHGDQDIERNLIVGGYFEIEHESGVVKPGENKLRLYKKDNDNNLYLLNSGGVELPLLTSSGGILTVDRGGTGINASSVSDGKLLIGNSNGGFTLNNVSAGAGISITNGNGTITIINSAATSDGTAITLSSGDLQNIGSTSGKFMFYVNSDRRQYAEVLYQSGNVDPNIDVPYYTNVYSSISGNVGTVNIIASNSSLYVENRYASSLSLKYFTQT